MATLETLLSRAAVRINVNASNATVKSQLLDYFNRVSEEVYSEPQRKSWLYKTASLSITTGTGRGPYDLAADFHLPLKGSFKDATSDEILPWSSFDSLDATDPDEDEVGDPDAMVLLGLNSSTGLWTIYVHPTPTSTITINYRYYALILEYTSSDYDTEVSLTIPRHLQQYWVHSIAALYLEDRGATGKAQRELAYAQQILRRAKEVEVETGVDLLDTRMSRGYSRSDDGLGLMVHSQAPSDS